VGSDWSEGPGALSTEEAISMTRHTSRGPRPRGDPFRMDRNPMQPMNQMLQTTTGLVIGTGGLMLGFGALNMLGGMVKKP